MRAHPPLFLALLAVAAAPLAAAEQRAEVVAGTFWPERILASDWESVVWRWGMNETHGLAPDDGGAPWCEPRAGGCARVFDTIGEYRYHCPLHPEMKGLVVVERRGGDPGGPPRAVFLVQTRGLLVTLDASALSQSRLAIESYAWDLGDGTTVRCDPDGCRDAGGASVGGATAAGRVVEHAYAEAGTYDVRLVIVDELGKERSGTRRVTVAEDPDAAARFHVSAIGHAAAFDAPPLAGEHHWDFGDGAALVCDGGECGGPSTVATNASSLVHVFTRGGAFLVTHTLAAPNGTRHTARALVEVDGGETFAARTDGLTVLVDASALPSYGNATHDWVFGDLAGAHGARAEHTFTQPGRWSVLLTLTDAAGTQTLEQDVLVGLDAQVERAVAPTLPTTRGTPGFAILLLLVACLAALLLTPETYK